MPLRPNRQDTDPVADGSPTVDEEPQTRPRIDDALRALADPTRRRILAMVRRSHASAGEIALAFTVSRPAISQHLKVLLDANLVTVRALGTRRLYRTEIAGLEPVRTWLEAFLSDESVGDVNKKKKKKSDKKPKKKSKKEK